MFYFWDDQESDEVDGCVYRSDAKLLKDNGIITTVRYSLGHQLYHSMPGTSFFTKATTLKGAQESLDKQLEERGYKLVSEKLKSMI